MGAWVLVVALGFAPAAGTLPNDACAVSAEDLKPLTPPAAAWPLPPMCAEEFEGACTSRDGRVRITIHFDGKRREKRVRSGFYGGEGWMTDTVYTGLRTLSIEDLA